MAARRKRKPEELPPREAVEQILAERDQHGIVYFPIKHFSPVCALQLKRLIERERPAAVLVEGPQDADKLIEWIVAEETQPPLTIFSSFVDRQNRFGQNGVLSPSEEVPARYRGWWPLTEYSPEYVALKTGARVGAELRFIDVPLSGTILYHHVRQLETNQLVDDGHLGQNAFFEALAKRQRRRSFAELWHAGFEVGGWQLSCEAHMRAVLLFAYCARHVEPNDATLEADGTLLREGHMRWVIDGFRKAHPGGLIVVVTGAFHSVALPTTKKKRAKVQKERDLDTMLTSHSYKALATLYGLNRLPGYGQAVWEQLLSAEQGSAAAAGEGSATQPRDAAPAGAPPRPQPFNEAAMQLIIEVMRHGRAQQEGISTADSVSTYQAARNLAALRRNGEITLEDLLDAVQLGYVKGDIRIRGGGIEQAARAVLTGRRLGRVTAAAGQAPLMRDFYDGCKAHRLDVSGARKVVRCDLHKQAAHRLKSAFLHRLAFLEIPLFDELDDAQYDDETPYYRGPDVVSGENLHLITETWAIKWKESVDARLLDLTDRGAGIEAACAELLREQLIASRGSAADTTRLCLRSAQMMLPELLDEILGAVEDAIALDASFASLSEALTDFVLLYSYRETLATQGHRRLLSTVVTLYNKTVLVLPSIANADEDSAGELLDGLQALVRIALTFEAAKLDRELLVDRLRELTADPDGAPIIRGAGFGILYSLGATREQVIAAELDSYLLSTPERVRLGGVFLDGLFMSTKSIFMSSRRLLRAINAVLGQLDWEAFKLLLPDLRRAFTQFIPKEIDRISELVSAEIGLHHSPLADEPVPRQAALIGAAADARVRELLDRYL